MFAKSDIWLALLVALFAFAASVFVADGRPQLGPDGANALHSAQNLAHGEGLSSKIIGAQSTLQPQAVITKPPLYPYTIAALIKLGVAPKAAGWIIAQLSFAFAAGLLYLLARRVLPWGPALLAGALFSMQMSGLRWSMNVHEEWLFIALTFFSLLVFSVLRERGATGLRWGWVLLGVISAAAVLTSYPGVALVMTIGLLLLAAVARKQLPAQALLLYLFGVAVAGLPPLLRFVSLWAGGLRPSFDEGAQPTWFPIAAGLTSTFQVDFAGRLLFWLYDPTTLAMFAIVGAFVLVAALLFAASRHRNLRPVALYIAIYLLVVVVQLAASGKAAFEPRYALPVEGLLLLLGVALAWRWSQHERRFLRMTSIILSMLAVAVFVSGQVHKFREFDVFPTGVKSSREYCPAPQTIAWIKQHIPAGAAVMGTQCTYQLIAESSDYYWLPIPPADEYASSPRYHERWQEADLLRISRSSNAKWIVLLSGDKGDPYADKPGYGEFVGQLLGGSAGTARIKLAARFSDGMVYRIDE